MKLQELHEGVEHPDAEIVRIKKALSGIKGVKVNVLDEDYESLDGEPLARTYLVRVTYTPSRGVKPTETIKLYKTADGDWEYLNASINGAADTLENLLPELRKELETAQKFHGKSSKVDEGQLTEGYEMKVLKAAEADGVRGCFFKGGTLFCDEADYDRVVKLLKKAEAKGEFDMPNVAKIKD